MTWTEFGQIVGGLVAVCLFALPIIYMPDPLAERIINDYRADMDRERAFWGRLDAYGDGNCNGTHKRKGHDG